MITIFEPLYAPGQTVSDAGFTPLVLPDNSNAPWRELKLLVELYRDGAHRRSTYTGLFSPRFQEKSGLSGNEAFRFINENQGADVVLLNPYPLLAYLSYNVWMDAEFAHPGICALADRLLERAGISWRVADVPRHPPELLCYCNFWVGTEQFWDIFVGGLLVPIAQFIEANPDDALTMALFGDTDHDPPAPFLPFIGERLISSFLSLRSGLRIASYRIDLIASLSSPLVREMAIFLQPMVDAADAAGYFSPDLLEAMELCCRLRKKHNVSRWPAHIRPQN